jgi:hypothetical protein
MAYSDLIIEFGGERCSAAMLDEDAPNICSAIRSILPYQGPLMAAKLVDREVIIPVPLFMDAENVSGDLGTGALAYYPSRQTICIFLGAPPSGPISHFGQITDNLAGMQRAGLSTWERQGLPVRLSADAAGANVSVAVSVPEFLSDLHAKRLEVWAYEPREIGRLRAGAVEGPFGQLASPILLAESHSREFARTATNLRQLAKSDQVDVKSLVAMTKPLLDSYEFCMGFNNVLPDNRRFAMEAQECLKQVSTPQEYASLMEEVTLYVGRVNYWLDAVIPWGDLGKTFAPMPKLS